MYSEIKVVVFEPGSIGKVSVFELQVGSIGKCLQSDLNPSNQLL